MGLIILVAFFALCHGHSVKIGLQTSWGHTPIVAEASEFFAKLDKNLFWKFVQSESLVSAAGTDREQYESVQRVARSLLSEEEQKLLQLHLASRSFSPAVELHRTLALAYEASHNLDLGDDADAAFAVLGNSLQLSAANLASIVKAQRLDSHEPLLPNDHIFPSKTSSNASNVVIVYANIGTPSFSRFHEVLSTLDDVVYVLRHRPPRSDRRVHLSGFGAEMHLKSTEYKVVDEAASKGGSSSTSASSSNKLEPVPKAEVEGLGARIAQTIAGSSDPLEALQRLSQNFPTECHSYRKVKLNQTFVDTVTRNQQRMRAGHTAVLINGRHVNVENVNFFELLDILGEEIESAVLMRAIPNVSHETTRALTIRHTFQHQQSQPHFDVRSKHVQWLNNVETDPLTASWPTDLRSFLRQQWPGMPFAVRRNALNVVSFVDLSVPSVVCNLAGVGRNMGLLPSTDGRMHTLGAVRVGLIPVGRSRRARLMAGALTGLAPKATFKFLDGACEGNLLASATDSVFEKAFEGLLAKAGSSLTVLDVQKDGRDDRANQWATKEFGLTPELVTEKDGFRLFVNGQLFEEGSSLGDVLSSGIAAQTQKLQMFTYRGQLQSQVKDLHEWFLNFNKASKVFSRFSVTTGGKSTPFVPFVSAEASKSAQIKEALQQVSFYGNCPSKTGCLLSHIAVVDVSTSSGVKLLENVLDRAQEKDERVRIALVVVNGGKHTKKIVNHWNAKKLDGILEVAQQAAAAPAQEEVPALARLFDVTNGIICNGRVIRIGADETFSRSDFEAVESSELKRRADHAAEVIARVNPSLKGDALSDSIMYACSVLGLEANEGIVRHDLSKYADASVRIPAKKEKHPALIIDALLDPLSEAGKKFGSILLRLISVFDCEVNLVLNPLLSMEDLPLKQFYRYVVSTQLSFDENGRIDPTVEATASFPGLPTETLFSMSLDVPDSWIVDAVAAPYDLDNLRLADITEDTVGALYELTHLTVTGSCEDVSPTTSAVRGMQLHLEGSVGSNTVSYETLVMETNGYFQLKAQPGWWKASLTGRSGELFRIQDGDEAIVVADFSGGERNLRVHRRDVHSQEPLLPTDQVADAKMKQYVAARQRGETPLPKLKSASGGVFQKWFGGKEADKKDEVAAKNTKETIHVFSIASGHLYERFLSIMMYTTVREAKQPVKFWFLKQFLSPQFKRFLPEMASKYGFEFELVTYNFPRWLRRQTEKQRHIWAYKILFLDVLFPLSVDRIIFVDADQIVQTDLSQLVDMDLEGTPYAFTPFCSGDNRRFETKGFRFWDSGYWKDTLGPLPYHISALFSVDLKRFRQMAAGDLLRGAYQQLTADPGNLANLDQDLPNLVQQRLPIFSLPEEWLWCETWCTTKSFEKALSIDLCNNPQSKTPKLENAKRIFPDWTKWDAELDQLRTQVAKQSRERDLETVSKL